MAALSDDDKDFLAQCEEEFKHRYTENDEEFMKVFNAEQSPPPILENRRGSNNSRRFDRRHNRHFNPYERNNDRSRGYQDRGHQYRRYQDTGHQNTRYQNRDSGENYSRGYSDYQDDNRSYGNRYGPPNN